MSVPFELSSPLDRIPTRGRETLRRLMGLAETVEKAPERVFRRTTSYRNATTEAGPPMRRPAGPAATPGLGAMRQDLMHD